MAAKLTLDRFRLLWLLEGAVGKFANAIDVNSGKVKSGWYIIEKCEYEK